MAWIAEQKNTLSSVFYLGSAFVYFGFDAGRRWRLYALAFGLFVLALLSKTATATLPAALLVVLWWRHGRLGWKRDLLPLLPWIALAIVAGLVTTAVEQTLIAGIDADVSLTRAQRLVGAGQALWFYVAKLAWPANLSFFYEPWSLDPGTMWQWFGVGSALAVTAGLGWFSWRRDVNRPPQPPHVSCYRTSPPVRGAWAAWLLFAGTLVPVLGFVDVQWFVFSFVADHFQYLACIGIIVPLSAGFATFAARLAPPAHASAVAASVAVAAMLGTLSWRHSHSFRDNVALYANAVVRSPGSTVAHHHLGLALAKFTARRTEAIAAYETALRINPHAAEVHEDLGVTLLEIPGRLSEAITHLETALQLKPGLRSARRALAGAHFDAGKALAKTPLGVVDAVSHYERAIRIDPNFAEAHFNLGNALLKDSLRRDDAIACFETALRLKPDFAEAHTNLGTVIASIPGRLPEAIAHFEAALRANPDSVPARNNLTRARQLRDEIAHADG